MGLFGFFGTAQGQGTTPAILKDSAEYGSALNHGRASYTAPYADFMTRGCWGPLGTATDDFAAVMQGAPIWRDSGGAASLDSIVAAYRREGSGFLNRLAGRFALALSDRQAQRIVLAVDPMGIERLTYAQGPGAVVFGSSAESVARSPGVAARLNEQAIFDYLMMHMVPSPQTIFAGVNKIPPSCCVLIEKGALTVQRYWSPQFLDAPAGSTAELKGALFDSLRAGVRAAEPDDSTGAFLSGGLDSSSVAGILAEVGPKPAKTFSIGFGYADYDELSYARIANKHFGCVGHEHTIHGNEIVDSFATIAKAYDEPFGNSSALPAYYCARLAKDNGVTHLLAGDGGDEIFAGNSRYVEQQVFEHYQRVPKIARKGLLEPALRAWPKQLDIWLTRKARGYIEKANIPLPARLETWNIVHRIGAENILHPDLVPRISIDAPFKRMQEVWDATPSKHQLNHMLFYDWHYTLADNDLRKVETMCTLAGIRVSYPMLDHRVIDMSTRISPSVMMQGGKLRHFYKEATTGFLPEEIIHKKKHGFGLPFGLWLQESARLRELIFGNLTQLRKRKLVRDSFIDQLLNLHKAEDARYYGVFLWVLAMLEQWLQEHPASR